MKERGESFYFLIVFLVSFILFSINLNFVSAETFNNCWNKTGTSSSTCTAVSGCAWTTNATDLWCMDSVGCCMDLNCSGGCMMNWTSGNSTWGGVSQGCWQYDGNKASCVVQGASCKWTANDQNQDPWCYIKNLADAQNKNPSATTTDIGCCSTAGCWNYDNNESVCKAGFQGNCYYTNNSYGGGWCNTKSCSEITTQANCTYAKQTLMMPCNWTGSACSGSAYGSGGFGFYNDSDSCFSAGGWYNSTGQCVMPTGNFGSGSGGFMFAGDAHCWFADNQQQVCGNVSGCVYCLAGTGINGTSNVSSNNICANKGVGFCEGHNVFDTGTYAFANMPLLIILLI